MHITIETFKKASKRLASLDNVPLNTAQEKLARVLGFQNTHAAIACIEVKSTPARNPRTHWLGMDFSTAAAVLEACLGIDTQWPATDDPWRRAAINLMRAVLSDLWGNSEARALSTKQIFRSMRLEHIESRYVALHKQALRHVAPDSRAIEDLVEHAPAPSRALMRYLIMLPAYKVGKLLEKHSTESVAARPVSDQWDIEQDSMVHEQHGYRVVPIYHALDMFDVLESRLASVFELDGLSLDSCARPQDIAAAIQKHYTNSVYEQI